MEYILVTDNQDVQLFKLLTFWGMILIETCYLTKACYCSRFYDTVGGNSITKLTLMYVHVPIQRGLQQLRKSRNKSVYTYSRLHKNILE